MTSFETAAAMSAEATRDRETEAAHGGDGKPTHAELWKEFISQYVTSGDDKGSKDILYFTDNALYWIEAAADHRNLRHDDIMMRAEALNSALRKIGELVISRALKNGLTGDALREY